RRRGEVLCRPRPQPAPPRQEMLDHLGRRATRARVLHGKGHDAARAAAAPDQLRLADRPGEDAFRDGDLCHHALRFRNSSFTIFPVAFTGSASRNSTVRGTLKFAISPRAHSTIAAASTGGPGASTTKALATSPRRSSGTPITDTCATRGGRGIRFSISAEYALNPPTMNMSLMRPTIRRYP